MRASFVYVPNGIVMPAWKPKVAGRDFEFTRILKPLEPFRENITVLSGLDQRNGFALGDGPGDHARAGATWEPLGPRPTTGSSNRRRRRRGSGRRARTAGT